MIQFTSKLCHVDDQRIIVSCSAIENGVTICSALGQDSNCEHAEERAYKRVLSRISGTDREATEETKVVNYLEIDTTNKDQEVDPIVQKESVNVPHFQSKRSQKAEVPPQSSISEPTDWTKEIEEIKVEVNRIGWSRELENNYLERTLGYSSRNKITTYLEIKAYLFLLKKVTKNTDPKELLFNNDRQSLFDECNTLISQSPFSTLIKTIIIVRRN